ncbi:MAG: hypothetical protein M5U12_11735 [Verrucomicrobia bacterium]|nr:hypothetical protein [Verrucomicrobiota bacterium]
MKPAALTLVLALVVASGCAPSRMLARAIVKAPNTYPDWLRVTCVAPGITRPGSARARCEEVAGRG